MRPHGPLRLQTFGLGNDSIQYRPEGVFCSTKRLLFLAKLFGKIPKTKMSQNKNVDFLRLVFEACGQHLASAGSGVKRVGHENLLSLMFKLPDHFLLDFWFLVKKLLFSYFLLVPS